MNHWRDPWGQAKGGNNGEDTSITASMVGCIAFCIPNTMSCTKIACMLVTWRDPVLSNSFTTAQKPTFIWIQVWLRIGFLSHFIRYCVDIFIILNMLYAKYTHCFWFNGEQATLDKSVIFFVWFFWKQYQLKNLVCMWVEFFFCLLSLRISCEVSP